MIGILYDRISNNTVSDIVRSRLRCRRRVARLFQMLRTVLNHLEITYLVKKSKKGTLKQIVPDYNRLKNFYTLLWDMPSNEGYINVISVMQKYFDQAISGNWSYNPENYKDGEVPLSVMANDLLTTYKLGWKTSYYQNTYDAKSDVEEPSHPVGWHDDVKEEPEKIIVDDQEECEACAI